MVPDGVALGVAAGLTGKQVANPALFAPVAVLLGDGSVDLVGPLGICLDTQIGESSCRCLAAGGIDWFGALGAGVGFVGVGLLAGAGLGLGGICFESRTALP
ncbi:MAG: hypothetical protein M3443_07100 [Actinomycetota bacterium]|nr:hypothetical protein [Actinomycetota bacterium]